MNSISLSLILHFFLFASIAFNTNFNLKKTKAIEIQISHENIKIEKSKKGKHKKGIISKKPKYRKVSHPSKVYKKKGKDIGGSKQTINYLTGNKTSINKKPNKITQNIKGGKVVDSFPTKTPIINPLKNLQNVDLKKDIDTSKIKPNPIKNKKIIEDQIVNKSQRLSSFEISYIKKTISSNWHMLVGLQKYSSVTLILSLDITGFINKVEVVRNSNITKKEYNMMEANAIRAIKTIKYLHLPKEKHDSWKHIKVTFNPKDLTRN